MTVQLCDAADLSSAACTISPIPKFARRGDPSGKV